LKNMEQVEAVTRMQNYISKNLQNNLTLNSIAKAAGYSPWHSAKLFKEYTGKTPFEYIRIFMPHPVSDYYKMIMKGEVEKYNPKPYGFEWDDTTPRFQYEPQGDRDYIEGKPVKLINK